MIEITNKESLNKEVWYWSLHVQPKKKKKPKPQPEASAEPAPPEAASPEEGKDEVNGFHANGSVLDGESLDSLSEQLDSASLDAAELDSEPATSETTGNHSSDKWWRLKKEGVMDHFNCMYNFSLSFFIERECVDSLMTHSCSSISNYFESPKKPTDTTRSVMFPSAGYQNPVTGMFQTHKKYCNGSFLL